jgi:cephalosporin-C deacetylase
MPIWDMPWDELVTYQGRNPKPADHDDYWATSLGELEASSPDVQITPSGFSARIAQCFDLTFTGIGNARIYAKYLRPAEDAATGPGIAVFHGYGSASPSWFELLPYVAEGYSVLAMDCRGQGGRSQDAAGALLATHNGHIVRGLLEGPEHLLYRGIFTDVVRTVRTLATLPGVDPARIGVTGVSQGGGLTLACAALEPSVKAVAPVYPFLSDYLRVWELDLAEGAYAELRTWLRLFDSTHQRVDQVFTTLGYIDIQHLAARIQGRVLMCLSLRDKTCPPSTQFAAYNKITSPKELAIYPDFAHEKLPGLDDRILAFFANAL